MRLKELPPRPSRKVLTTGMPAQTEASKLSATPRRSASAASFWPCRANSALLAVTTGLPAASALSTARLAGSPAPPMSSTNTSIDGSCASATGSATQRNFFRSIARFFARERALIATISIGRPQRAMSLSRPCCKSSTTAEPTMPSPARPTFSGAVMESCFKCAMGGISGQMLRGGSLSSNRSSAPLLRLSQPSAAAVQLWRIRPLQSAALGERHHVVQLRRPGLQEAADIARRLADALLVLDQRNAHMALAIFAKARARRYRDAGFFDQKRREFHAAERLERLRDRRPGEHRGARRRHSPAGAAERIHQRIAPSPVDRPYLVDAIVGAVERRRRRHLDRRESAIVEIGFHPRQRRDQALVADRKTDAPAGHRISLGHRGEFDGDVHGARHLQERRRRIVVEIDLGVGQVRQHQQAMFLRERDQVAIEIEIG